MDSTMDIDSPVTCCGCRLVLGKITMKLISMLVLMLSDADVSFTILGLYTFWTQKQYALIFIVGAFFLTYCGGCLVGRLKYKQFLKQFKGKVKDGTIPEFDWDEVMSWKTETDFYNACKEPKNEKDTCLYVFYSERRQFRRTLVLFRHSVPYFRTMTFAWQTSISPIDFAGLLNANGLWSFTSGIGMQGCSLYYMRLAGPSNVLLGSLAIGCATTLLSIANIVLDFPGQLASQEQLQMEKVTLQIQAERATNEDFRLFEDTKNTHKASIMSKHALANDPLQAVRQYGVKMKEINEAKCELMQLKLEDLKDSYDVKKRAYAGLMRETKK